MHLAVLDAIFAADLTAPKKMVLMAIATHANEPGQEVFPSIARIASLAGLDRTAVMRNIASLEKSGHLAVRRATGVATRYRLTVNQSQFATGRSAPPVAPCDSTGRSAPPPPVALRDPNHPLNHPLNPSKGFGAVSSKGKDSRTASRKAVNPEKLPGAVWGWFKRQPGVAQVMVKGDALLEALRTYGPQSFAGLVKETAGDEQATLSPELFQIWFQGRRSEYSSGWDGYPGGPRLERACVPSMDADTMMGVDQPSDPSDPSELMSLFISRRSRGRRVPWR